MRFRGPPALIGSLENFLTNTPLDRKTVPFFNSYGVRSEGRPHYGARVAV